MRNLSKANAICAGDKKQAKNTTDRLGYWNFITVSLLSSYSLLWGVFHIIHIFFFLINFYHLSMSLLNLLDHFESRY